VLTLFSVYMKRIIDIVLGVGFGDEGKGKTVDYLCDQYPQPLVVRFSGGQQCGHTVMNKYGKHIHASFPSGTLSGHAGYITKDCVISPIHMYNEWEVLRDITHFPLQLAVHPLTPVTTPMEIGANRKSVDNIRHGSCGMGVGATMKREAATGHHIYAQDLMNDFIWKNKLINLQKHYYDANNIPYSCTMKDLDNFTESVEWFKKNVTLLGDDYLKGHEYIIFEGSQGILLDMEFGMFPNVTYANTTSKNVWQYVNDDDCVSRHYVTRAYATRHGNGAFVEGNIELTNTEHEINITNEYQGDFRVAPLDVDLVKHAIDCDKIYGRGSGNLYCNGLDQIHEDEGNLVIDKLEKVCDTYVFKSYTPQTEYKL
jgi:adenylosuccinate synthase